MPQETAETSHHMVKCKTSLLFCPPPLA